MRAQLLVVFMVASVSPAYATGGGKGGSGYDAAKAEVVRIVGLTKPMHDAARLKTSPRLSWTRDLIQRPYSDWGIVGVGEVFKEKRVALENLRRAEGNLRLAKTHLETARTQAGRNPFKKGWVTQTASAIEQELKALQTTREELRGTEPIWRQQWVLTVGIPESQSRILRAFLEDKPADQHIIDQHLAEYFR